MAEDYYKTLGVDRNVTPEALRKAYKKLAQKYHPDLNPDDLKAKEKFKEVQNAYDVLGDAEKRKKYDQFGAGFENFSAGPQGGPGRQRRGPENFQEFDFGDIFGQGGGDGGADFSDIFRQFTGGGGGATRGPRQRRAPQRGADVQHEVSVPFKTAIEGGEVQLNVHRPSGNSERITAKIPPGIEDGKRIRLRGQGEQSPNGGPAGDLLILIHIQPHKFFTRKGNNLEVRVPISLSEAILGGTIEVPTPSGGIHLKIPPGTSSGKRLRIRGQGIKSPESEPGDIFAEVQIVLPDTISDELKQRIEEDQDLQDHNPRQVLVW
ncbi:MAG: J domain-containing protein [Pirellulaceae bacterium]